MPPHEVRIVRGPHLSFTQPYLRLLRQLIEPPPTGERHHCINLVVCCYTASALYLALAVGNEGGQAGWCCRPGQKPQAGLVLSQSAVTACILLNSHDFPILSLLNILPVVHSLSKGNLFMDWVTTVASLKDESDC